jgi:hypothetical protein
MEEGFLKTTKKLKKNIFGCIYFTQIYVHNYVGTMSKKVLTTAPTCMKNLTPWRDLNLLFCPEGGRNDHYATPPGQENFCPTMSQWSSQLPDDQKIRV